MGLSDILKITNTLLNKKEPIPCNSTRKVVTIKKIKINSKGIPCFIFDEDGTEYSIPLNYVTGKFDHKKLEQYIGKEITAFIKYNLVDGKMKPVGIRAEFNPNIKENTGSER